MKNCTKNEKILHIAIISAVSVFIALVGVILICLWAVSDHPAAELFLAHEYLTYNDTKYYPLSRQTLLMSAIYETDENGSSYPDFKDVKIKMDGKMWRTKKLYAPDTKERFIYDHESGEYQSKTWYLSEDYLPDKLLKNDLMGQITIESYDKYYVTKFSDDFSIPLDNESSEELRKLLLDNDIPDSDISEAKGVPIAVILFKPDDFPTGARINLATIYSYREKMYIIVNDEAFDVKNNIIDLSSVESDFCRDLLQKLYERHSR